MATNPAPAAPSVRQKSPNYPNASLPDAIERVRRVFEGDRAAPLEREVVARHIGYSGISGAADKTIASLMQYGLMERVGKGEIRVSSRALDILHPDTPHQRLDALRAAAFAPPVFKSIRERFPEAIPSNDALRSYLVRLQFFDTAINAVISSYTETCQFLERELANGSGGQQSEPSKESRPDAKSEGGMFEDSGDLGTGDVGKGRQSPPASMAQTAVFPLIGGTEVKLTFPTDLNALEFEELEGYLLMFLKNRKRQFAAAAQNTFDQAAAAIIKTPERKGEG